MHVSLVVLLNILILCLYIFVAFLCFDTSLHALRVNSFIQVKYMSVGFNSVCMYSYRWKCKRKKTVQVTLQVFGVCI